MTRRYLRDKTVPLVDTYAQILRVQLGEQCGGRTRQQRCRIVIHLKGASAKKKASTAGQFIEIGRARFQRCHAATQKIELFRVRRDLESWRNQLSQARIVGLANILAVQILEFLQIETCR